MKKKEKEGMIGRLKCLKKERRGRAHPELSEKRPREKKERRKFLTQSEEEKDANWHNLLGKTVFKKGKKKKSIPY